MQMKQKSRESRSGADREETEVVREFYATKEKHILVDEGIMAKKRPRKVSGSSKKKKKKLATGFPLCVCVCDLVYVCQQAFLCVTPMCLTLICQTRGVTSTGGWWAITR